jgi:transposase
MTHDTFTAALTITGADANSRTSQAARLALVDGMTPHAAAQMVGVRSSAVYRATRKLTEAARAKHCPTCGHPL